MDNENQYTVHLSGEPSKEVLYTVQPHWAYREIMLLAAVGFISQLLVTNAAAGLLAWLGDISGQEAFAALLRNAYIVVPMQVVVWIPILGYIVYVVQVQYGRDLLDGIDWKPLPKPVWGYVRTGILLALASGLLGYAVNEPMESTQMQSLFEDQNAIWLLAVFGVLAAPLLEEIVFRGFLFSALEKLHGRGGALIGTSVVFSLLHGAQYGWHWPQLSVLSLLGCVLGVIRMRSGSIQASTIVHASYNGLLFGLMVSWPD